MQDDGQIVEENVGDTPGDVSASPIVTEPVVVPEPVLTPEPIPEPVPDPVSDPESVPEPIVETTPEPATESLPEPIPEPISEPEPVPEAPSEPPKVETDSTPEETPRVAPTAPPVVDEPKTEKVEQETTVPVEEKPIEEPKPIPEVPKEDNGIPPKVLELTDEELKAAVKLWGTRHIGKAQAASVKAEHQRLERRLQKILAYVKANPESKVATIASRCNYSAPNTSYYLRILNKRGLVQATGVTTSRRYS